MQQQQRLIRITTKRPYGLVSQLQPYGKTDIFLILKQTTSDVE